MEMKRPLELRRLMNRTDVGVDRRLSLPRRRVELSGLQEGGEEV